MSKSNWIQNNFLQFQAALTSVWTSCVNQGLTQLVTRLTSQDPEHVSADDYLRDNFDGLGDQDKTSVMQKIFALHRHWSVILQLRDIWGTWTADDLVFARDNLGINPGSMTIEEYLVNHFATADDENREKVARFVKNQCNLRMPSGGGTDSTASLWKARAFGFVIAAAILALVIACFVFYKGEGNLSAGLLALMGASDKETVDGRLKTLRITLVKEHQTALAKQKRAASDALRKTKAELEGKNRKTLAKQKRAASDALRKTKAELEGKNKDALAQMQFNANAAKENAAKEKLKLLNRLTKKTQKIAETENALQKQKQAYEQKLAAGDTDAAKHLKGVVKQQQGKLEALHKKLSKLRLDKNSLKEALDRLRQSFAEEKKIIENISKKRDEFQSQVKTTSKQLSDAKKKIEELKNRPAGDQASKQQLEQKVHSLELIIRLAKARAAKNDEAAKAAKKQLRALEQKLAAGDTDAAKHLKGVVKQQQEKLEALHKKLSKLRLDKNSLKEALDRLRQSFAEEKKIIENISKKRDEFQSQLKTTSKQLADAKKKIEGLKNRPAGDEASKQQVEQVKRERDKLQSQLAKISNDLDDAEAKIRDLEASEATETECWKQQRKIVKLQKKNKLLSAMLRRLRARLDRLQKRIKDLIEENKRLKNAQTTPAPQRQNPTATTDPFAATPPAFPSSRKPADSTTPRKADPFQPQPGNPRLTSPIGQVFELKGCGGLIVKVRLVERRNRFWLNIFQTNTAIHAFLLKDGRLMGRPVKLMRRQLRREPYNFEYLTTDGPICRPRGMQGTICLSRSDREKARRLLLGL